MYPYLVADIGGTNARFALVTGKTDNNFKIDNIAILNTAHYPDFESALRTYLEKIDGIKPTAACIAIAGPVTSDQIKMTNLNWTFSCRDIAKKFNLNQFIAINDFAAVASACGELTDEHLRVIKPGLATSEGARAVFGPGTGLGVAGLIRHAQQWIPVPCEGGHVNLAPADDFEAEVVKAGISEYGHLSAETFVSGPGLVNLYRAICSVRGIDAEPLKPSDITEHAMRGTHPVCVETLNTFCGFAGSFAGNLALTYGAKGGVYIAGGVFPRFIDFLLASPFVPRFSNKGVMSHFLEAVPVYLIRHPETAFVGAAAWLEQNTPS